VNPIPLEWVRDALCLSASMGADLRDAKENENLPVTLEEAQSWKAEFLDVDDAIVILPLFLLLVVNEHERFVEFLFSIGRITEVTRLLAMAEITLELVE